MRNKILNIFAFCAFFACNNCSCGPASSGIPGIDSILTGKIKYQTPLIKSYICNDKSKSKFQNEFIVKTRLTVIVPGGHNTNIRILTNDQIFWDRTTNKYGKGIALVKKKYIMETDLFSKENPNINIKIAQQVGGKKNIYTISNADNKENITVSKKEDVSDKKHDPITCYLYYYPTVAMYRMFVILDPKNEIIPEGNENVFGRTLLSVFDDIAFIDMTSYDCAERPYKACEQIDLTILKINVGKSKVNTNQNERKFDNFIKSLHLMSPLIRVSVEDAFCMVPYKVKTKYSIIHTFKEFSDNYNKTILDCEQELKKESEQSQKQPKNDFEQSWQQGHEFMNQLLQQDDKIWQLLRQNLGLI